MNNNWSWKQKNVSFEAFLVGNQGWYIKIKCLESLCDIPKVFSDLSGLSMCISKLIKWVTKRETENFFSYFFNPLIKCVGMKTVVKCYKDFFGYLNALKTHGALISCLDFSFLLQYMRINNQCSNSFNLNNWSKNVFKGKCMLYLVAICTLMHIYILHTVYFKLVCIKSLLKVALNHWDEQVFCCLKHPDMVYQCLKNLVAKIYHFAIFLPRKPSPTSSSIMDRQLLHQVVSVRGHICIT